MVIDLLDIKKEIENLPPSLFGKKSKISIKSIKNLKLSRKNINIYFQLNSSKEYIFRVNIKGLNKDSFKESKKEYNLLKILDNHNITNNKKGIYFSKKGVYFKKSYLITSYIKGKNIQINKENIKKIAKKMALINKTKISLKDRLILKKQTFNNLRYEFIKKEKYIENKIPLIHQIYLQTRLKIEKNKPKDINKDQYLVHGDLNPKNIISQNNKIYFIDWEYLKISSPLLDVAKLFDAKSNPLLENIFLKEYTKNFKKIENISEKIEFYKDFQAYLWLVSSTKYYLEIIFENPKYTIKNNKTQIIKDILKNYKKLLKKGYADKDLDYLKKILYIY